MVTKSITILFLFFNLSIAQIDSVFTFVVNSNKISFNVPSDIYVNLFEFQKFISNLPDTKKYTEMLTVDLTGDGIKDTLSNNIFLFGNECQIISYISSNSGILFSDTLLISSDYGNYENIWGSDELFEKLLPYSNLYNGYLNKLEYYDLSKENVEDKLDMYLLWETTRYKKMGLSDSQIVQELDKIRKYVDNYRGKYIHNLSLSNYDTYLFLPKYKKFVIFYSP